MHTTFYVMTIDGLLILVLRLQQHHQKNEYLNVFKNNMYEMIKKTEFIKVRNGFQDKLKQDLETIKSLKNELAFADKSTNSYELSK